MLSASLIPMTVSANSGEDHIEYHLLTRTCLPPSVGLPSSQYTLPSPPTTGAPSLMLWLVISSLVIGVSHVPTGASFAAMTMGCGLVRGSLAVEEEVDLQIANNAIHLTELPYQVLAFSMSMSC